MQDDKQTATMVLARRESGVPLEGTGSIAITSDCEHPCWISQSGQDALARGEYEFEIICLECIEKRGTEDHEVRALPGAVEQLTTLMGLPREVVEARMEELMDKHLRNLRAQG